MDEWAQGPGDFLMTQLLLLLTVGLRTPGPPCTQGPGRTRSLFPIYPSNTPAVMPATQPGLSSSIMGRCNQKCYTATLLPLD